MSTGSKPVAEKTKPCCARPKEYLGGVDLEVQLHAEETPDLSLLMAEPLRTMAEEDKIVQVAQVSTDTKVTLDEMIQRVQERVPPDLRGEVADREAASGFGLEICAQRCGHVRAKVGVGVCAEDRGA